MNNDLPVTGLLFLLFDDFHVRFVNCFISHRSGVKTFLPRMLSSGAAGIDVRIMRQQRGERRAQPAPSQAEPAGDAGPVCHCAHCTLYPAIEEREIETVLLLH